MMSFQLLAVLFGILAGINDVAGNLNGPPDRSQPEVTCIRDEDMMRIKFVTRLNGDDINSAYSIDVNEQTQQWSFEQCGHTMITETDEFNVQREYFIVETLIDIANPTYLDTQNPCGFQAVTDGGVMGFQIMLALRNSFGYQHAVDRDYMYTCYENTTTTLFLMTNTGVVKPPVETPEVNTPEISLTVLRQDSTTNNAGFFPDTSCIIGESLKLRLSITNDNYINHLTPWGLYAFNTKVASSSQNNANFFNLVGVNGCSVNSNPFGLTSGWDRTFVSTILATYETGVFECKRFLNSGNLVFSTYYDFCVSTYDSESKCDNYCTYNQNLKRRRRETGDKQYTIETTITILTAEEADRMRDAESTGISTPIIATIVAVTVILLMALIFVAVFVCLMRKRRNNQESHSDVDSRASSDRKLPIM